MFGQLIEEVRLAFEGDDWMSQNNRRRAAEFAKKRPADKDLTPAAKEMLRRANKKRSSQSPKKDIESSGY